jgi:hypothetical protein
VNIFHELNFLKLFICASPSFTHLEPPVLRLGGKKGLRSAKGYQLAGRGLQFFQESQKLAGLCEITVKEPDFCLTPGRVFHPFATL